MSVAAEKWLPEHRRAAVSGGAGVLTGVVLGLAGRRGGWTGTIDSLAIVMMVYLAVYVVVTIMAFAIATPSQITSWARRQKRGTWLQRYVFGTAPGPGLSIFVGLIALGVAVLWLPGVAGQGSGLPTQVRMAVGGLLVVASWIAVVVSFAVAYHADDLIESEPGLDFPGTPQPCWTDYVYFSVSVSITFGTTDVTVKSPAMRRTITVHGVLAFVFNTVTLGAVVGFLVS